MNVEISHRTPFQSIKILVNNKVVIEQQNTRSVTVTCDSIPASVSVEFSPFKISPTVRINDFMVNYWLADLHKQDHKLDFTLDDNFFSNYKSKDIQSRMGYLTSDQQKIAHFQDKYVGVNNLHPELVDKIKSLLT
jgi:hypothetical protein